jgi:hypothetical protein
VAESPNDLEQRVASLANRLRLVQLDLADEAEGVRREHLGEEVERALAGVSPDRREEFLRRVGELFPSWDANVAVAPKAEVAPARSGIDERELKNASFLVERLVELAPHLSEDQRAAAAARLARAGLAVARPSGGLPEAAAEKLRQRLQLRADEALDPGRTAELATLLAELALSLDQVVWNTWRTIAPRSDLRRSGELARTMGRFAAGDADTARGQVKHDLERVRQLTAALISSVGQAGRQFAQRHFYRFSVDAIKDAAGPGTIMKPQAVKCWEKYVELTGSMDAVTLESELLQSIAKYAEDLVKGLNR